MEKFKPRFHTFVKKLILEEFVFAEQIKFHVSVDISVDSYDTISFVCDDNFVKSIHQDDFNQIKRTVLQDVVGCTELSALRDLGLTFVNPWAVTDTEVQTDQQRLVDAETQTGNDGVTDEGNTSYNSICQDGTSTTGADMDLSAGPGSPDVAAEIPHTIEEDIPPVHNSEPFGSRKEVPDYYGQVLKKLTADIVPLRIKEENKDSDYEPPEFGETTDEESDTGNRDVVVMPTPVLPPVGEKSDASLSQDELTCPLCPSKFRSQQGAERHLRVKHDIGNVYICKICQDICPSNTAMHEHMKTKHAVEDIPVTEKSRRGRRKSRPQTLRKAKVIPLRKSVAKTKPVAKSLGRKRPASSINKHKCSSCPKMFDTIKAMQRHMQETHNLPKPTPVAHKCNQCAKSYMSLRALRRHVSTTHHFSRHQCDLCDKEFTSKESLYHHKRGLHGESKPYKCEQCDASFNFNHSLRLHQLKHSGKRPHQCSLCEKSYLTSNHLKMHVEGVHANKKKYSCSFCGKAFSYTTSLRVHEMAHGNIRPYKCKVCGMGFINSHALKYHTESKHAIGIYFPCNICGKEYKTEFLMKTHRRRHTADGTRFMCDICGHLFMYKSTLDIHSAVHSDEKTFQCSTCGKSFKTYATLYSHQYVHKTDMPFECPDCGKAFKTKERCKAHQRRHSGLKPFDCDECGRCFPDKGGLTKHKKTVHCMEKTHVCSYCGKACSRADNLRVHMKAHEKTVHPNINEADGSTPGVRKRRPLVKIDSRFSSLHDHPVEALPVYRLDSELDRIASEHGYERLIDNLIDRTMDKPKLPYTQTRPDGAAPPPSTTPVGESLVTTSPVPLSPPLTRVYSDSTTPYDSESGSHIVPLPIGMTSQDSSVGLPSATQGLGTTLPPNTTALQLPPHTSPYMYMWPYMHHTNPTTSQSHENNYF